MAEQVDKKYYLRAEFVEYLSANNKDERYAQYVWKLIDSYFSQGNEINWKSKAFADNLANLKDKLEEYIKSDKSNKSLRSYKTAFTSYEHFYEDYLLNSNNTKEFPQRYDGLDSLFNFLFEGKENDEKMKAFIKQVIESSYFFCSELSQERHNEFIEGINGTNTFPARWTDKYLLGNEEKTKKQIIKENPTFSSETIDPLSKSDKFNCSVIIDKDGNYAVRKMIHDKTGYWVSAGAKISHFVSYKISHIWGRAYDPRFFTSFWNLALVPAWANDLLDKPELESNGLYGEVVKKLKCTMKAICLKIYEMKDLKKYSWKKLEMDCPSAGEDVISQDYFIQVIGMDKTENKYNKISTKIVSI